MIDLRDDRATLKQIIIARLTAGFLNGMAALDDGQAVTITDSRLGLVWRLDICTGEYNVIHQHESMTANNVLGLLIGVNGLKIVNNYMYYNNSPKRTFCRVRIDTRTGRALGPYEIISHDTPVDDFAIGPTGVRYLAGLVDDVVTRGFPSGCHEVIAGSKGSTALMTATSAAFGRSQSDRNVLDVTTRGEGGKIMAVFLGFRVSCFIVPCPRSPAGQKKVWGDFPR